MLALLFYGYATGVFSSRKLEQATYDSVAFRYLAGNTHPDHDTIAHFRKRFLEELKPLFVEILLLAQAMGFLKLGRVSLDGTKVKANASKHSALSWGHIQKLEARLREEVDELMQLAEEADGREETEGMDIPAELARREARLKAIDQAKQKLVERAAERQAAEHAEYEGKVAKRQAQRKRGNKPKGREPKPPRGGIRDQDQINLTDEDSRIMPVSGGGFEQCYNAQALVDNDSLLIVAVHVTPNANDKKELKPALAALHALPESLGRPQELLADNGYFSGANVELCSEHAVLPYIAVEAGSPPLAAERTLERTGATRGRRRCGGADEIPVEDPGGSSHLRATQSCPRARLWDHQIGDGLCAVLSPRSGGGRRGVDSGQHRLESEKNVQPRLPPAEAGPCHPLKRWARSFQRPNHRRRSDDSSISCLVVQDFGSNVKFQKCL